MKSDKIVLCLRFRNFLKNVCPKQIRIMRYLYVHISGNIFNLILDTGLKFMNYISSKYPIMCCTEKRYAQEIRNAFSIFI